MIRVICIGAALACLAPAAPALACSVVVPAGFGLADKRAAARREVESAAVIVDAEVVRPHGPGREPALIRAHRVLKGPQQAFFEIAWSDDSCSVLLTAEGARLRLSLIGGPGHYAARLHTLPRHIDRLLRSDRRRDWPWRPSAPPAAR
ncbi:MAG TPA: hypothetical protein VGB79_17035 [Allosphingosinicella sp.]|jgi:hypothetical protein